MHRMAMEQERGEGQRQLCFARMPTAPNTLAPGGVRVAAGSVSQWKHGTEGKKKRVLKINVPLLPKAAASVCAGGVVHPQPWLCAAAPLSQGVWGSNPNAKGSSTSIIGGQRQPSPWWQDGPCSHPQLGSEGRRHQLMVRDPGAEAGALPTSCHPEDVHTKAAWTLGDKPLCPTWGEFAD